MCVRADKENRAEKKELDFITQVILLRQNPAQLNANTGP